MSLSVVPQLLSLPVSNNDTPFANPPDITLVTRGNANFHAFVSNNYYDPDQVWD